MSVSHRHHSEIERPEGAGDFRAAIARFGRALGLTHLGVNPEIVPPGGRASILHAHSLEEEFVFVIEGAHNRRADRPPRKESCDRRLDGNLLRYGGVCHRSAAWTPS